MIVTLNGVDVTQDGVEGLDRFVVSIRRRDEEGRLSKSSSSELTFHGEGWDIIREELIDNPAGKFNKVDVMVYDDCCEGATPGEPALIFEGIIRGDTIDWCDGECFVKARLIEHTTETKKMDCVKSKLIWDNQNGFKQQYHPRVVYCIEIRPSGLQDVVMIFGIIMNITFYMMYPIVLIVWIIVETLNFLIGILNTIIDAINTLLPGNPIGNIGEINIGGNEDENVLQMWGNLIDDMNYWIIGCGRKHPTPLVRSYVQNVCDICGLDFDSSIFTNPSSDYYNTLYFSAGVKKGTRNEFILWQSDNDPVKTLEGLLEDLKVVFSGEYRIQGSVLQFEREDYFWNAAPWLDYAELLADGRVTERLCYSWRDDDAPAYGRFAYTEDPVDWCGNEAKFRYNDYVNFNAPPSELQKGMREILLPFSPARHRNDGVDRDVVSDYAWWPDWTDIIEDHDNAMLMNNGTALNPKLLIWDGVNAGHATVRKFTTPYDQVPDDESYNARYWFNEDGINPNTGYPTNASGVSLYARFHSWKHPKVLPDRGLQFTFAFRYNCDHLNAIDPEGNISIPPGSGRTMRIELNTKDRIMTIIGHV